MLDEWEICSYVIFFSRPLYTQALNLRAFDFYIGVIMLRWCFDGSLYETVAIKFWWNFKLPHGDRLRMSRCAFSFCKSRVNGLSSNLWLLMRPLLCTIDISLWYLTLTMSIFWFFTLLGVWWKHTLGVGHRWGLVKSDSSKLEARALAKGRRVCVQITI